MKSILQVALCLLTISYTLSGATYTVTSGLTQDILDISGQAHPYSGPNLSSFVNIPYAELYRADLTGAELVRADLFSANLARADLTGANLYRADLFSANLARADLTGANLYRANLNLTNMRGADLIGANLFGAEFYFAILTGADLTGADLEAASFVSTAIWTNSNLYGATLPIGYNQAWFEEQGAIFEETVPEASSYALLLGGLALGLVALRRR